MVRVSMWGRFKYHYRIDHRLERYVFRFGSVWHSACGSVHGTLPIRRTSRSRKCRHCLRVLAARAKRKEKQHGNDTVAAT